MEFPQKPHNAMIFGMTDSGKTHMVLNIVEQHYKGKFDNIVILCPTYHDNKTYNRHWLQNKNVKVLTRFDLMNVLRHLIENNKKDTLVIIDDWAADKSLDTKRSALAEVAYHGRHKNLTTWFITQKYTAVPNDFRDNCSWILVTRCVTRKTFKSLQEQWDLDDSVKDKLKTDPLLIDCTTGNYSI